MKSLVESQGVPIPVGSNVIHGDLAIPRDAKGLVIFAHGSGSSRHSPRNRYVAQVLNDGAFATLLIDLLTAGEEAADERTSQFRFDIPLLTERLVGATEWAKQHRHLSALRCGYFGASTGAAAALSAAARRPDRVSAIVSRGGRPDLAGEDLPRVSAPTLFIVGERDYEVIALNRQAADSMQAPCRIEIVPGATHLFEEKGALEQVAYLARTWFEDKMPGRPGAP